MRELLAKRLKQCRKEKGLTQWEVAVYCDISEKAYQNYELMTREPKLEILAKIADLFDVSLDYLVGRTDQKQVNRPIEYYFPIKSRHLLLERRLMQTPTC